MARRNAQRGSLSSINKSLEIIDSKMEDIFQSTYSARQDNKKVLDNITDDIYGTVNRILSGDEQVQNVTNITRLYSRLDKKLPSNSTVSSDDVRSIADVLTNNNLLSTMTTTPEVNRYIKLLDKQYDMICKYMPKLEHALAIKKDNVLSADNFTKEFINFISDKLSGDDKKMFDQRAIECRNKYKFDELCDKIYDDTSHYGEYILWCVPYKKAFEKLLKEKNVANIDAVRFESVAIMESGSFVGSSYHGPEDDKFIASLNEKQKANNVNITFDKTFLLSESVMEYARLQKTKNKLKRSGSVREAFLESCNSAVTESKTSKPIFDPSIDYGKEYDRTASDGFIQSNGRKSGENDIKVDEIPGCITKKLIHYNVFPIYIEEVCIGYYYFEFSKDDANPDTNDMFSNSTLPIKDPSFSDANMYTENPLLRELSRRIADMVDAQFINTNQDLKDEIYIMLKYNEMFNIDNNINNIKVTFLPPEDVFHFYFKLDEKTHHGISDLQQSLIPAMFWCLLDLSTTMGLVTRAQDKRIYYVKQNVDTNVAKTLMNVINQVKKGNMGVRQMESMNNILNIVGRYNDHVIPMGPNGEAPIQFEVMNGQNIETPDILMNKWEEAAINPIVPLEIVNSSLQMDFAIKYSMANSKMLRDIFKRQFICERHFSDLFTRIYNYEYNENETQIKVTLPAPAFLSMTNMNQLITNTADYINLLAAQEYPNGPEDEKAEFIRLMFRHMLPTHINVPLIDETKKMAQVNLKARTNGDNQEEE